LVSIHTFKVFFRVCYKYGVVAIPITTFYSKEDKHLGENLIRWAFCKKTVDIEEAAKRLK
jgi:aspartate/methionine/tyrosine aminotransferase